MFPIDTAPLERESEHALALRPVNCPGHVQIYAQELRSYRDLPLRLAEFGVVHRREPSGSLAGLFRLREFTQDDGHVFCRPDQVQDELVRFCDSLRSFYRRFGFDDVIVGWSTRPAERLGDDASWDRAELLLRDATTGGPKKPRVQLGITLDDKDGKRVIDTKLAVDAGDWLVVGRSLKGTGNRGQIVALTCKL